MIANPYKGEVILVINGRSEILRLSLGALAALERHLGAQSLADMAARFSNGTYQTQDLIAILDAGLYGGGSETRDIACAKIEGGAKKAACAAIALLRNGFGLFDDMAEVS